VRIIRNVETRKWDVVDGAGRPMLVYGRTKAAAEYVSRSLIADGLMDQDALVSAYESGSREFRARVVALKSALVSGDVPTD
jgi:hypothetical protein